MPEVESDKNICFNVILHNTIMMRLYLSSGCLQQYLWHVRIGSYPIWFIICSCWFLKQACRARNFSYLCSSWIYVEFPSYSLFHWGSTMYYKMQCKGEGVITSTLYDIQSKSPLNWQMPLKTPTSNLPGKCNTYYRIFPCSY